MTGRIRLLAAACAAATLALGLALQLVDRTPVVDLVGSVLYVVLVGLVVVLIRPRLRPLIVAALAFAVAAAIELAQLTAVPAAIVAAVPVARLVLGSSFDPLDLVAYAVGALVLVPLVAVLAVVARPRSQKISTPAR